MTLTDCLLYAYDRLTEVGWVLLAIGLPIAIAYELITLVGHRTTEDDDDA